MDIDALRLLATREGQWGFEREGMGSVGDLARRAGVAVLFPLPEGVIAAQALPEWNAVTEAALVEAKRLGLDLTPPPDRLPPNPVGSWEEYFASTLALPLHPMYGHLVPFLPASGDALELGAGNGPGPIHLLERGLRVTAVDGHGEALTALYARAPHSLRDRLTCRIARFEDLALDAGSLDLLVAGYSLFFLSRTDFERQWPIFVRAVRPGGVMMGQFLGVRDDWAGIHTAHSLSEVEALLAPFETLYFEEAERDGRTSQGVAKHWHVHHWIVRV